jgi:hypothetical protein
MNQAEFESKLKQMVCLSDWHFRYYSQRSRKWKWIDYWVKSSLGVLAIIGALMTSNDNLRVFGAVLAGVCSFVLATLLPNFHWDSIVSGINDEREEWTRIYQGYYDLYQMSKTLDRNEMLLQEFQKIEERRKAAESNDRALPEDKVLLKKIEREAKIYHGFKPPED